MKCSTSTIIDRLAWLDAEKEESRSAEYKNVAVTHALLKALPGDGLGSLGEALAELNAARS